MCRNERKMFSRAMFSFLSGALLIIAIIPDVASYNKYGRTCKDIGCRSDETCVMAEDPCTSYTDKCGRYPTCRRTSDASCTSMVCGENEYCKSENGAPRCVRKSTGMALPPGLNQVSHRSTPRVTTPVPSPPPRSSSYGGRYGYSGSRNTIGDGSIFNRLFGNDRHPRPTSSIRGTTQANGNYYNTHTHVDSHGNRVWTFSENDEMGTRTIPKRQTSYPTEAETHGSSDTSKNSDGQSYPARSSGYPSGSGYPSNSGYSSSGSSRASDSTNQPQSGYPSSGSSGYPLSGSSSHQSRDSSGYSTGSGYPSRNSGSSGYPSGSGYPGNSAYSSSGSSRASDSTNQPQSGYPFSGSSAYPSSGSSSHQSRDSLSYPTGSGYPSRNSGSSGYPSGSGYPGNNGYSSSGSSRASDSTNQPRSGYPSSGSSGYPSSGSSSYQSRDSSGYPTGSGYPNSGSSGYPDNSRNPYGEETVRRTGANPVNAGYPNYPRTSGYPSVYPEGNPPYRGNYPAQNAGYPSGYPYNNQYPPYSNQGSHGYSQNYPQGGYQGQNYMTTTKRPGIRDQLTNFARNMAEKVLTQTILDRVTGRN